VTRTLDASVSDEGRIRRALRWGDVGACLVLVVAATRFGARTPAFYVGLVLTALSLPLWVTARLQLGRSFSLRPEARELVTHGLYSRIRHPIYVFGCLAYFGALLALQLWPILAVWLALLPIELVRVRREERVLAEAFGPAYEDYRAKTWS
jgi:protein-S-isoprenylcysteine O-methyltransferase Ste14